MRARNRRSAAALAALLLVSAAAAPALPAQELAPIRELVAAGRLDEAESALRRALEVGDSAGVRDLLGLVLVRRGDGAGAEREFLGALELEPEYFPARQNLGRLYLQQGRVAEAMSALAAAAELAPLDRELTLRLARLELEGGKIGAGEARLQSLAEEPSVRALIELSRSLARRGENQAALEHLETARQLAPNSQEVLNAYARVHLALEAPVPAIRTLEALRRMHPSVAVYPYLLGVAQLQVAESATAIESIRQSLEIDARQARAWVALGLAYNSQDRLAEGREALERALQLRPDSVDAQVALAEAEEGLGELDLAEARLRRALAATPDAAPALFLLGKIQMTRNRYDRARDLLLRAVEESPNMSRAHYQLSLAFARLRDRDGSRRHLELYRQALAEEERRVIELRTAAGLGVGGMRRGG